MSDSIVIPSPSALLSSPVQKPQPLPIRQKKRVHRKSESAAAGATKPADPNRPKQTKSRNGCQTCKLKRLKCDETKPACKNCAKRGVECGGYVQKYKWRQFDEQNITFKLPTAPTAPKTTKQSHHTSLSFPKSASNSTSPEAIDPSLSNDLPSYFSTLNKPPRPSNRRSSHNSPTQNEESTFSTQASLLIFDQEDEGNNEEDPLPDRTSDLLSPMPVPQELHDSSFDNLQLEWEPPPSFDINGALDLLATPGGEQIGTSLPSRLNIFGDPFDFQADANDLGDDLEEDVEEIARMSGHLGMDWTLDDLDADFRRSNNSPTSIHQILAQLPRHPQLSADSPEMLTTRFDRNTCGIMSMLDGPTENPWRKLILPLMHHNPIVFDAVASMACFQASRNEPQLRARGTYHAGRVLAAMRAEPDSIRTDVALASSLCLAFGESWDCSISAKTGIDYIRVCKRLVKGALRHGRQVHTDAESQKRLKFLCKTWIYIDVIARLTSVDEDVSNDFELVTNLINGPLDPEIEIDPLMGCGTSLFPIIGRVANLVRKVCRVSENSLEVVQEASRLQQLLRLWKAPGEYSDPEDPTTTVSHALQTAEAYRWATLLYLHQAVPELVSMTSAELAKKTLLALANVPLTSRTVIVQIYPLLAAGCEATGADREFVALRWNSMSDRMAIGNIDRCADVVKEVWRRRDIRAAKNAAMATSGIPPIPPALRPPYAPGSIDLEGFPHWAEPFHGSRSMSSSGSRPRMLEDPMKKNSVDTCPLTGIMDPEFSVRGNLHWVAVMKAFNWEVLLG